MNCLLSVCLVAVTLAAGAAPAALAQSPVLQKGVSVQMPVTVNAAPVPAADSTKAKIVAVTANGSVYFGIDSITLTDLAEKVKSTPFQRGEKLYIKADARLPYEKVLQVLEAARTEGVAPYVLLTAQSESSAPGAIVPPTGLEVLLDPPPGAEPTVVQLVDFGQPEPVFKINNQTTSWAGLPGALSSILQDTNEKVVRVKADGRLPFGEVARLIDVCHSTGAKVVLGSPNM